MVVVHGVGVGRKGCGYGSGYDCVDAEYGSVGGCYYGEAVTV